MRFCERKRCLCRLLKLDVGRTLTLFRGITLQNVGTQIGAAQLAGGWALSTVRTTLSPDQSELNQKSSAHDGYPSGCRNNARAELIRFQRLPASQALFVDFFHQN
jgi:hypothetical protein